MNTRTFGIGDIHGHYDALLEVLDRIPPVGPADTLLFLGDYL